MYSTYARGLEALVGTYTLLDLVPNGRDEDHLGFSMQWVRHHDRYGTNLFLDQTCPIGRPMHRRSPHERLRDRGAHVKVVAAARSRAEAAR